MNKVKDKLKNAIGYLYHSFSFISVASLFCISSCLQPNLPKASEVQYEWHEQERVMFIHFAPLERINPVKLDAVNAVVLRGPHANIRWPGTETGKLFYPAWNVVRSEDLKTDVSTKVYGFPDGDAWAPLETNTTRYDHYWFWPSRKQEKRKSLDQLMERCYRSVYYRFVLPEPKKINHIITMEEYREGERIREYRIEGLVNGEWIELVTVSGNVININQTAQITDKSNIKVQFFLVSDTPVKGSVLFQTASFC